MSLATKSVDQPPREPAALETLGRELTWQALVGALLISVIVGGCTPYIVLKLGMTPNLSVVSALLGAIFLNVAASRTRGHNRLLNNVIQTAGTSASSTAFMCIVAAAFDYLDANETIPAHLRIGQWEMFIWLTCSGMLGVVFTVLFRRYFIDDPKTVFADGVATAQTIRVLDSGRREGRSQIRTLGLTAVASAVVGLLREKPISALPTFYISNFSKSFSTGLEWNLLGLGTGLLVGLNVSVSMLLGTLAITCLIGPWVIDSGIAIEIARGQISPVNWNDCRELMSLKSLDPTQADFFSKHCSLLPSLREKNYFQVVVLWAMWPATGLMISSAITAVALRWRSIVDTFRNLRIMASKSGEDMSLSAVVAWMTGLTLALALVQWAFFGMPIVHTVITIAVSCPLMIVGMRVLGETNTGPVSVMTNAMQALFAALAPAQVELNLIAGGVAGHASAQSQGMIQDYRAASILGSTPRLLTYVQLAAVPIGAAAVATMYPLLIAKFGLGGGGLTAPPAIKLVNMAILLSHGLDALPPHALAATAAAVVIGVAVAVVTDSSQAWWVDWIPSVPAFGFALILPGVLNIPIALGGILGWAWLRWSRVTYERYAITAASGLIAGEAIVGGLLLPVYYWFQPD